MATLEATRRLQPVSWAGQVGGLIPRGGVGISHEGSTEQRYRDKWGKQQGTLVGKMAWM